ncbi:hypothetical protein AX15_003391 [Amanita polypyramis BW_CC]|nr:hypothetical protein AX15_003391 [Amanita polypyramis BW_CC]
MAAAAVAQPVDYLSRDRISSAFRPAEKAAQQPDIEYHPNEDKYKARTARRLAEDPALPNSSLPEGFPRKVESPLVWEGKDFKDEKEWVYELTPDHLKEIDDAIKHFRSLGKSFGHITPSTFPLPTLGPALRGLSNELHNGRGFFVIRTIPVDNYSREDNILLYTGVSSYVGELRGIQDKINKGFINHIKDLTPTHSKEVIGAPAYTTDKQVFHTDSGDIVALFALDIASEGGTSRISSTWRAYNELAETRPDLVRTLAEPWPFDSFGATPAYTERPLLFYHDNRIIVQYARRNFTGFLGLPRTSNIPPITEAQAEALDALHFLGEKYNLGLNFKKGDIQYINNLSIFHARDSFVDTPEHTRHLLRIWARNEELGWKIPKELEPQTQKLFYSTSPDEQEFPLEPIIRDGSRGGGLKNTYNAL